MNLTGLRALELHCADITPISRKHSVSPIVSFLAGLVLAAILAGVAL